MFSRIRDQNFIKKFKKIYYEEEVRVIRYSIVRNSHNQIKKKLKKQIKFLNRDRLDACGV
tara:strand:- start:225 stop:404 length:180 start_codon:yes stop_codon:yes gene_type:complete